MRAYAKQANDIELETAAAEIKLRARRRIGEISKTLEKAHKTGRGSKVQIPSGGKSTRDTLKAAGISTSAAQRCEKIAVFQPLALFEQLGEIFAISLGFEFAGGPPISGRFLAHVGLFNYRCITSQTGLGSFIGLAPCPGAMSSSSAPAFRSVVPQSATSPDLPHY